MTKKRETKEISKSNILSAAVELAKKVGYNRITREGVSKRANVSENLVSYYFNTMHQLRNKVMRYAVTNNVPEIVAQGLALKDKQVRKASPELKAQAVELMTNY